MNYLHLNNAPFWKYSPVLDGLDYCIPISDVAIRRHLHSARRHCLIVSRHSLSSYRLRAFTVASPTASNSLSDDLRDLMLSTDSFRRLIETQLFSEYWYI